ncbi:hypothetical protein F25303_11762 [Fusarium sp. NRRL 25303]|nr:hypothetical protein F25303_11762 [Fusarium sp. NRRL 25303]
MNAQLSYSSPHASSTSTSHDQEQPPPQQRQEDEPATSEKETRLCPSPTLSQQRKCLLRASRNSRTLSLTIQFSETSEKQVTPPAGSTPEPSLPVIDSAQEAGIEANNVSGIPDANTETQPPSNGVRWTIPGMPQDSVRLIRKLILPERHFGSRRGNAAVRNGESEDARRTFQAKKSKWLAEVCKEMK